MQHTDPLHPGSVLADRYRIGALLGTGGMSSVHRADDAALGREVAVKVIERSAADRAEMRRIRAEIDLLATLNHRALVTLFDAGHTVLDGRSVTYLVMELVDGPTLGRRMADSRIPADEVARMCHDLAEALVVVHARGVVHRDIKPANILLAPSLVPGREFDAKLADFGIASLVDGARLTATGTVLGTAAYLSPEQATGARVGPASDIYSLGLVLLETLTGRREFPGSMLESVGARLARDPEVPGELGYEWKSLLTAMTQRDPEARPTAAGVLERVAGWSGAAPLDAGATGAVAPLEATAVLPEGAVSALADEPTAVQPVAAASARGRRRRLPVAALLVGGASLAVAVPLVALQWGPAPTPPAETAAADPAPKAPTAPVAEAPAPETTPEPDVPAAPAPAPAPITEPGGNGGSNGNGGNGSGSGSNSGNGGGNGGNGSGGGGRGGGNGP